ncbi:serine hydrolase [Phenylobacterium sp.]|uniref:serine hydrolase domain-containing protein n=1 Tax=Phenylobacterium sp. TaxID=1871053 RepID=UPI0026355CC1|nr:serine hydrolase domain-containing protein [Phenylobacterium sp.]
MDRAAASLPRDRGFALRVEASRPQLVWAAARGNGVSADRTVRIASVTKTFVAAATLRLVERGALQLDDPVGPLLSAPIGARLARDGYDLDRVTVRMLLTHTAGVFDYAQHPLYLARVLSDPAHIWTREEQIAFAVDHGDPLGAPGALFAYSDTGYLMLGDILERVTGLPLAEAVPELLELEDHGVSNTWFEGLGAEPAHAPPRARQGVGATDAADVHPSADLFGGGGLLSTPGDLARFLRLLLRGDILGADTVRTMTAPTPQSVAAGGGGYGMGLARRSVAGEDCYGHGGFWGVVAWYCPGADLAVAGFVSNTNQIAALSLLTDEVLRLCLDASSNLGSRPAAGAGTGSAGGGPGPSSVDP